MTDGRKLTPVTQESDSSGKLDLKREQTLGVIGGAGARPALLVLPRAGSANLVPEGPAAGVSSSSPPGP